MPTKIEQLEHRGEIEPTIDGTNLAPKITQSMLANPLTGLSETQKRLLKARVNPSALHQELLKKAPEFEDRWLSIDNDAIFTGELGD